MPLFVRSANACPSPQPITVGVPLARGSLREPSGFWLRAGDDSVPVQTQALARWSDGSVKWLLLDAVLPEVQRGEIPLPLEPAGDDAWSARAQMQISETRDEVIIDTGTTK